MSAGTLPTELQWEWRGQSQSAVLRPGDSACIAPFVEHRLSVADEDMPPTSSKRNPNGSACSSGRRVLLVRIPGLLTGETLREFGTFSSHGRERAGAETMRWY